MTNTPPGWYPAPGDPPQLQRWWDGTQWTATTQAPPSAAPSTRSKAPLIALIVVAVVIIGTIGVGVTVVGGVLGLASEFNKTQKILDGLTIYSLDERPGYDELVDRYESVRDTYSAMYASGEIYTIVPDSPAGRSYYDSFVDMLEWNLNFLKIAGGSVATDEQELDDQISFSDEQLTELVRRFEANEGLVEPITVTDPNGNSVVTNGSAPVTSTDEILASVAAYRGQPDANGSYAAAGSEMIAPLGMYLTWVNDTNQSACISGDPGAGAFTVAYYCNLEPQIIYINQTNIDVANPDFLDTVRHEVAHHLIGEICGVTSPPVAGGRSEPVANSFAILYLGMSESHVARQTAGYAVDDASRAAAEAIHNGDCG